MHLGTSPFLWVMWVSVGVMGYGVAAHRNSHSPFLNPRNNEVFPGASGTLVEALRQLLGVPSDDMRGHWHPHDRLPPRPPRYMLNLYKRLSQGGSNLPRQANTVRSFKPRTGDDEDMLLYNVTALTKEQVLGAWLHLRGSSSGRGRLSPRLRPTRILVYLFPAVSSSLSESPTPVMTHTLSPHQQEIELTRGVREVVEDTGNGRLNAGLLGIRVEELRRGRYVSRSPEKLSRRPPLLFVYSSDPALLDLQALGAAALNLTKGSHAQSYSQSTHLKRYTRDAGEGKEKGEDEDEDDDDDDDDDDDGDEKEDPQHQKVAMERAKRAIGEGEWMDAEMEAGENAPNHHHHNKHSNHHPLLTNELPFDNQFDQTPLLPKVFPPEEEGDAPARRHRRRRRKHHRKRGKGEDDNLIPLPENYSKTKWGESERRRKNKRRRRNRKLPDDWMAAAQNTVSNEANSLNFGAGVPGGLLSTRPCERHKLEVDFKTLGWDHWIIAPTTFNAYYCAGICPNPLTKQMSGSNHAIIQSMIYSMGLRPEVPAPCCVPDKLDAATLLAMEGDDFVLRSYSKMVVTSCSCQ